MMRTIQREILLPQSREQVWQAITDSTTLAEWMYPNDFEPRVGHRFTFHVPPNPKVNFEGLAVRCEVLECEPPCRLAFSWSAGGLADSRVIFRLEVNGAGTQLFFEHSGFDVSLPFGEQAFRGAEFGWAKMLKQLAAVIADADAAHQVSHTEMVGGLKVISVKEGCQREFETLFAELRKVMRTAEPGCLLYSLLKSRVDDRSYIVQEQYRDAGALALHESSPHGKVYFPKIRALLDNITVEYFHGIVP